MRRVTVSHLGWTCRCGFTGRLNEEDFITCNKEGEKPHESQREVFSRFVRCSNCGTVINRASGRYVK